MVKFLKRLLIGAALALLFIRFGGIGFLEGLLRHGIVVEKKMEDLEKKTGKAYKEAAEEIKKKTKKLQEKVERLIPD